MHHVSAAVALLLVILANANAVPLTTLIFEESEKLEKAIQEYNATCAPKNDSDDSRVYIECFNKRRDLSGRLGQFVALVNDELAVLGDSRALVNEDNDSAKQLEERRKLMKLESRFALHNIRCLNMSDANTECAEEGRALERDRAAARAERDEWSKAWSAKNWVVVSLTPKAFVSNFVDDLATNDVDRQLQYYAEQVDYYDLGKVTTAAIANDLKHDIAHWFDRNYSVIGEPTVKKQGTEFTAEFDMKYSLSDAKQKKNGILGMYLQVSTKEQPWRITRIHKQSVHGR